MSKAADSHSEACYMSARDIPVPLPVAPGITLRDEGGDKGVEKLGYVSEVEGSTLTIGPLAVGMRSNMQNVQNVQPCAFVCVCTVYM